MSALPAGGAMAAVFAPAERVAAAIARVNAEASGPGVSLAAENGTHRVVSGPAGLVTALLEQFSADGMRCQKLAISHAFHSALLDPMLEGLEAAAAAVTQRAPELALVSNLTGEVFAAGTTPDGAYWRRHAREPVRFAAGVEALAGQGVELLVELGPRPVLGSLAQASWPAGSEAPAGVATLRPGVADKLALAEALAGVYAARAAVDFAGYAGERGAKRIALPSYPFERVRHWVEAPKRRLAAAAGHPLLGEAHHAADGSVTWTQELRADEPGWLGDHRLFGRVVAPGALHACLAVASNGLSVRVTDGQVLAPLVLPEDGAATLQLLLGAAEESGERVWRVFARRADAPAEAPWRLLASGKVAPLEAPVAPLEVPAAAELAERDVAEFYAAMAEAGLQLGPSFQSLTRLWGGDGVARGEIAAPDGIAGTAEGLHPAVLDGCYQVLEAALPEAALTGGEPYVPVAWEALELWGAAPARVICEARLRGAPTAETVTADLWLSDADGMAYGRVVGLAGKRASRAALLGAAAGAEELLYELVWREVALPVTAGAAPGCWLLLGDGVRTASLEEALTARGAIVVVATGSDAPIRLADGLAKAAARGVAVTGLAWLAGAVGLPDAATAEAVIAPALGLSQALLSAGLSLPQGLVIVTEGAQATSPGEDAAPLAAALWGFGRTLQAEQPTLRSRLIDLAADTEDAAVLAQALLADGTETQLARRGATWWVPRLVRQRAAGRLSWPVAGNMAHLEVGTDRTLEGLRLTAIDASSPGVGEVTVLVRAAGVNFRDVLNALGLYPGDAGPLGGECAGVVTAVGAEVSDLAVGDAVFGFAPGAFATHCMASAALLRRVPAGVDLAAAATMPITFCTALAAFELAGLRGGDRTLIHAGAGGVGLAAIQLAQAAGAEVFVTASAGKRDYLRRLGLRHVFDSRSTSFAADILAATDGQGVEVVLNSLTSEGFIAASLSALASGGRFVEIGKRDIWTPEQMAAARPDVAYHILAIDDWIRNEPARVGALLDRLLEALARSAARPLPRRCFDLSEAPAALRLMQRAGHVGKLVLTVDQPQPRGDGGYLVTGGLGALGVAAGEWLAECGAGRVVLAGRRAADEATQRQLTEIAARTGCVLEAVSLDVADADAVRVLVARLAADPARPLRGVIHAAGVLDDGVISVQSWERFARVLAPKLLGAWHLHQATETVGLDFFVLYSSVAGVLGSAGQANYAAANAALDALAAHRRSRGLAASSVAWGPWDVGMAASARARVQLSGEGPVQSVRVAHRGRFWYGPQRRTQSLTGQVKPVPDMTASGQ